MLPEEAYKRAKENFLSGLNCTQSVVKVFAEELGFDAQMMLRLAQPLGGGMCRMREVCGTVSGMMLCLGMLKGTSDADKTSKDTVYADGQKLAACFREENGSIICRELLGLVPMGTSEKLLKEGEADSHEVSSPVSEARTSEYYKKRPCAELCGVAAKIFAEFLNSHSSQSNQEQKQNA